MKTTQNALSTEENCTIKEIGSSIFFYFKLFHSAYNLKKFYLLVILKWKKNAYNLLLILKKKKKTISLWKTVLSPLPNSPYPIKKYDIQGRR